jgi:hypothetical protein
MNKVTICSIGLIALTVSSAYAEKFEIRAQDTAKTENTASGAPDGYGDSLITRRPGNLPTSATYKVTVPKSGKYKLSIDYAAAEPRPLSVTVNGRNQSDPRSSRPCFDACPAIMTA